MADLTPEALAAAMWDDAIRPAAGDQWHLPEWEDLWGHRDELEMPGGQDMAAVILAAASMAIERLAPAHAAMAAELAQARQAHDTRAAQLTAELEEARGQLVATAAPGDTVVIAFGRRLTAQQGHDAYERFRRLAPGVNIVIADDVAAIEAHHPGAERARYRGALEDIDASPAANAHTLRALAREALDGGRG